MATGEAMWASSQTQALSMKRQATTEDAGLMWTDEAVLVAALTRHNRSLIYEQSLLAVSAVPYSTDLFRRNIERSKEVNQAAHHMVVALANFWDTRAQSALCRHCGVRLPDHREQYCSADGCDGEKCAAIRDQVWAAADQGKLLHIHDLLPATAHTRDQALNNMLALMSMYSAEAALTETVRMVHNTARASFTHTRLKKRTKTRFGRRHSPFSLTFSWSFGRHEGTSTGAGCAVDACPSMAKRLALDAVALNAQSSKIRSQHYGSMTARPDACSAGLAHG